VRTIFEFSAENAEIADWVVDGAVSREPLSGVKFPDQQGKYREFSSFGASRAALQPNKLYLLSGF
jgi:hypothetical protein